MTIKEVNVPDARPLITRLCEYKNTRNVKNAFMPPKTLGMPAEKSSHYKDCMAMDRCIRNVLSGFKNDIAFTAAPMFVGYAMLSNVSQEALIRAGVETVADEATRKLVQWTYDEDDGSEDTDKEKILAELETQATKYKLKESFREAACKDGYFGGCLVYIDLGDLDDVAAEEPLVLDKKTFKKGSLRGLKVIEPINVYPGEYNTSDPTDEHYFNPEYWYVLGKKYHASRFLYMAGNDTPVLLKPAYNFFGIPQAQLALDYVAHFVANRESAQELLNKFSLTCWKTDMTQALQGGSCNDLVSRVRLFNKLKTNNGTMVLNKDTEDMMQINTPLSGVRDIVEMSLNLLTAVWRIPKIKYLGEGEGGLNASSKEQMRSYYDYVMSYKEKLFTQPMETVLKLFQLNLGWDINEAIGFKFPVMWDMDDSERAQLNKQQADRDALYLSNGVLSQEEVRRRLSLDKNSDYTMIDVDDVPEPQEQPLPEVDKEEQNETDKKAMDSKITMDEKKGWHSRFKSGLAMDDRWITIGHRDAEGDDEGRKGRHILLKEGEDPKEALERTIKKDLDKDGKVGKKDDSEKKEEKSEPKEEPKKEPKKEDKPEQKPETKPEAKEEPKEEKKESVSEKTPALEYADLLDKENSEGLTDAEKARKKELEEKEGFGMSEEEKVLEELSNLKKRTHEIDTKLRNEKEEYIKNDPEYKKLGEQAEKARIKAFDDGDEGDFSPVWKLKQQQRDREDFLSKEFDKKANPLKDEKEKIKEKIESMRGEIVAARGKKIEKEAKELTQKYENFAEAKTMSEAKEYAKSVIGAGNFTDADNLHTVNIMNKTLTGLMGKYGSVDKLMTYGSGRMSSAIMHANNDIIEINTSWAKMTDEALKKHFDSRITRETAQKELSELEAKREEAKARGEVTWMLDARIANTRAKTRYRCWTVQSSAENFIRDTVMHEFGHTIMFRKMVEEITKGEYTGGNIPISLIGKKALTATNVGKTIRSAYAKARKSGDIYEISEYADTNYHEFFAETFAMRESGQKVPDYIEKMLKEVCGK